MLRRISIHTSLPQLSSKTSSVVFHGTLRPTTYQPWPPTSSRPHKYSSTPSAKLHLRSHSQLPTVSFSAFLSIQRSLISLRPPKPPYSSTISRSSPSSVSIVQVQNGSQVSRCIPKVTISSWAHMTRRCSGSTWICLEKLPTSLSSTMTRPSVKLPSIRTISSHYSPQPVTTVPSTFSTAWFTMICFRMPLLSLSRYLRALTQKLASTLRLKPDSTSSVQWPASGIPSSHGFSPREPMVLSNFGSDLRDIFNAS